jgi:hypothetical protein
MLLCCPNVEKNIDNGYLRRIPIRHSDDESSAMDVLDWKSGNEAI